MTDSTASTEAARQELLERIWCAQAKALATILEQSDPKELQAALLNVTRQFLSDNGVDVQSVGAKNGMSQSALAGLAAKMPEFLDKDDDLPQPDWTPLDERGGD